MKTQLFINGEFVDPIRGGSFPVFNPATGEIIVNCSNATTEDVDKAVNAAKACLNGPTWGYSSTGAQRAIVLRKLSTIIASRKDELARLDSLDMGKPLREALADINDAIDACTHFATLAEEQDATQFEEINNNTTDFKTNILHEPIGVIGAITPWNYPFLMGIWKVIPAIAAGCCTVLKPSELAPLSCLLLGEMCFEAGLPAGALNVIPGLGADAGTPLSSHPGVDKVSFTGSAATARKVMALAAQGPRAVSMELGGKSPIIVFEDADIDAAVDWIITGILWGSGQVCSATSRLLVHKNIRATVMKKLLEHIAAIVIRPTDISAGVTEEEIGRPQMGPVVSKMQYDKIWAYIDEAKAQGLCISSGGVKPGADSGLPAGGYFIPPTVIEDPPITSRVWTEEIFGPVLCVREFATEEEAVAAANASDYGLAAAVMSADEDRCRRLAKQLRAGIIWTNCCQPAFITAPWGGVKGSGFGRELGKWGLEEFTAVKQVTSCKAGYSWGLW